MSPSVVLQKLLQKGSFKNTSVGDILILNSGEGSLKAIRTKSPADAVLNADFVTGIDEGTGNPVITSYPLDGALPSDIGRAVNADWYAQDHPVVEELILTLSDIANAAAVLQSKCAGDTAALNALNLVRNQYGF